MRWERYLRNLYRNLKKGGSYQSADKLYETVKREGKFDLSLRQIEKFLRGEDTYTLNKEVRRKFQTNSIPITSINKVWEADLADLFKFQRYNDGYRYILGCIDSFSRKLYVRPLKTKRAADMVSALKEIFAEAGTKPRSIRSDRGSEFTNHIVTEYLQNNKIGHVYTSNLSQAALIERCWKSLKKRMIKYMEDKKTKKYIDVLDQLVQGYNNTFHSVIGMTPNEVAIEKHAQAYYNMLLDAKRRKRKKPAPAPPPPPPPGPGIKKEEGGESGDAKGDGGDGGGDGRAPPGKQTPLENVVDDVPQRKKKKAYRFPLGTHVRISLRPEKLVSEYGERWSREIYTVDARRFREGIDVYKVSDAKGEVLIGTFYAQELQRVNEPEEDKLYDIREILKERTVTDKKGKKHKEYFVSFVGFPRKFNQWVQESAVKTFKDK